MAKRDERLNSLRVRSACDASWDAMQGNERRRFCETCRKDVFDFAEMTPRDIHAHLQASRGHLCARLTHDGGRLRVLQPSEPAVPWTPRPARRVSPFAATLVSAWLGMGSAAAQPAAPPSSATESSREGGLAEEAVTKKPRSMPQGATLRGKVIVEEIGLAGVVVRARDLAEDREHTTVTGADGVFLFTNLPPGLLDLSGTLDGFEIETRSHVILEIGSDRTVELAAESAYIESTSGDVSVSPPTLRQLFDESVLVVSATVETSAEVEVKEDYVVVVTELQIGAVLKGDFTGRSVRYRHAEYLRPSSQVAPGTKVIVFLSARDEPETNGEVLYELTGYSSGLLELDAKHHAAYRERLAALDKLESGRAGSGLDLFELTEWLVATAENPLTRLEGVRDLNSAFYHLENLAEQEESTMDAVATSLQQTLERAGARVDVRQRLVFLAAALDDGQKERLREALVRSETLNEGDRHLHDLVRRLDAETARRWLEERFRHAEPPVEDSDDFTWWLQEIAEQVGGVEGKALADEASAQNEAFEVDAETDIDLRISAIDRALMRELATLMAERAATAPH